MNQYKKLGFNDTGSHLEKQVILSYISFLFFCYSIPFYHISLSFDLKLKLLHQWTKSYMVFMKYEVKPHWQNLYIVLFKSKDSTN